MDKNKKIDMIVEKNNGYLFSAEIEALGISRTTISTYVREKHMERMAKGIYATEATWPDELFLIQKTYSDVVFSGETALYLNQMIDREYGEIVISVPRGFSGSRLRARGIVVHQEKAETYELGRTKVVDIFGNEVWTYNRERCICDLIKNRERIEIQNFQTAVTGYMRSREKDLSRLIKYAEALGIKDQVMRYVEVMV